MGYNGGDVIVIYALGNSFLYGSLYPPKKVSTPKFSLLQSDSP
jgi:hypothetical protein